MSKLEQNTQLNCIQCNYKANSEIGLKIHCGLKHSVKNNTVPLECPWCQFESINARALSLHSRKLHNKNKIELYTCLNPNKSAKCPNCEKDRILIDVYKGFKPLCGNCSRKEKYKNKKPWNAGLTKETDERMAVSSKNMRKHYAKYGHHQTGKTKQNNELIRKKATKISISLNEFYEKNSGWSLGLTKETSKIILKRGEKISKSLKGKYLSKKHVEALKLSKILPVTEIVKRLLKFNLKLNSDYIDSRHDVELQCIKCESIFYRKTNQIFYNDAKCPNCHPPWSCKTSKWQKEIFDFIKTISPDVILNDRTILNGKELDIFIPSQHFAIECNGLYWHSEQAGRFDQYHAENKRKIALQKDIKLLTLFEDEWQEKSDIIKSMIKHKLHVSSRRIFARNCKIEINYNPSSLRQFFDINHIDGYVASTVCIVLMLNNQIVGACTLRWAKTKTCIKTMEIARLCFNKNTHIPGGISKLISKAITISKDYGAVKLITYADGRFGGSAYSSSILNFDKLTIPRFWWTDCLNRYDRFRYRADKKNNLTEAQVALKNGVSKIYGCSNLKYSILL